MRFVHGSLPSRLTVGPSTSSATTLASSPTRASSGCTISRSLARQLAFVRRAQPVLHAHQRFQRLRQLPGQPVPRPAQTRIAQRRRHALRLTPAPRAAWPARTPPAPGWRLATGRSRRSLPAPSTSRAASTPAPLPGCPRATASTAAPAPDPAGPDADPLSPPRSTSPAAPAGGTPNSCAGPAAAPPPPASARRHAPAPARSRLPPTPAPHAGRGSVPGSPPWPSRSSTSSTRTLKRRQPGDLPRRRQTLEAVEQFQLLAAHARHHRRQLTPTPQRPGHRFLRRRIGQAITPIAVGPTPPSATGRTIAIVPTHATYPPRDPHSKKGNGGRETLFTPARSFLRLGSGAI